MWTEFLKVKPVLDSVDLNRMMSQLSSRFATVAKKFGVGLKNAITTGGIFGLATAAINKLLNPLKETQDTLDRLLNGADDLVTMARQFETTSGKLFKLQQLGKSTGLDEATLQTLLTKFQVALAEARQESKETTKPLSERPNFAILKDFIGEKDTAEAFFQFAQTLQKQNKDTQVLVQSQIFGEKLIGRSSEFFQTDFQKQLETIGAKDSEVYTPALEKTAGLSDLRDALTAKRTLDDAINKSRVLNEGMIVAIDKSEKALLQQEEFRLKSFETLKTAAAATDQIKFKLEEGFTYLTKFVPDILGAILRVEEAIKFYAGIGSEIATWLRKISESRFMRGIGGFFGGGSDKRTK